MHLYGSQEGARLDPHDLLYSKMDLKCLICSLPLSAVEMLLSSISNMKVASDSGAHDNQYLGAHFLGG